MAFMTTELKYNKKTNNNKKVHRIHQEKSFGRRLKLRNQSLGQQASKKINKNIVGF